MTVSKAKQIYAEDERQDGSASKMAEAVRMDITSVKREQDKKALAP